MERKYMRGHPEYVNNHIHTTYSFSPYTPESAVYEARSAGLLTAGIMDHDTVAGAQEFVRAGETAGVATTVGMECRCSMVGTPFEGRRLNNPDQKSVAYLALHGIPRCGLNRVRDFIAPYRTARAKRSRAMTERLDILFAPYGVRLDFTEDVMPVSLYGQGGTITERHMLYALAVKLASAGANPADFLEKNFDIVIPVGLRDKLKDPDTPYYTYHLLGLLKGNFMERFYIDATGELPHVRDFLLLASETGAITAYAYLGDVKDSVTGDKKDNAFEDAYLDELAAWLKQTGFHAMTYMPARNSPEQLERVMALCRRHGLFQISGEDINSPFQSFVCKALDDPRYAHLTDAAWALIGHEKAAAEDASCGMFSRDTVAKTPNLYERIEIYAKIGREGFRDGFIV